MNWEPWFCPSQDCSSDGWMVKRDSAMRDAWAVAAHVGDHPFTLAAPVPVCPRCGTSLLALVELDGRAGRRAGAGLVFDVARSLS